MTCNESTLKWYTYHFLNWRMVPNRRNSFEFGLLRVLKFQSPREILKYWHFLKGKCLPPPPRNEYYTFLRSPFLHQKWNNWEKKWRNYKKLSEIIYAYHFYRFIFPLFRWRPFSSPTVTQIPTTATAISFLLSWRLTSLIGVGTRNCGRSSGLTTVIFEDLFIVFQFPSFPRNWVTDYWSLFTYLRTIDIICEIASRKK